MSAESTVRSRGTPPGDHRVHFYETSGGLVEALGDYVAGGLAVGHPVVVIATDAHVLALKGALGGGVLDIATAERSELLTFVPAEATLEAICENGEPSWERFHDQVGALVRRLRKRHQGSTLRAYGEMVDLLCASGRVASAMRLEEMWNKLAAREHFTLVCAYHIERFGDLDGDHVRNVHALHTHAHCPNGVGPQTRRDRELDAATRRRAEVENAFREQIRINENLARIAAALTSELDLERLVQKVTDEATTLCRAQFGAFFHNLVNDNGESYTLYTLSGAPREAFSSFPMPRNTAIFKPTFDGTSILRSDDITEDPRYGKSEPYRGMPQGHLPVRSYLAIPVKSRTGEMLGGLFFGHADTGVFTAADEQLLVGVAAQAAVAMDNARLFQAARRAQSEAAAEREKLKLLFKQSPALIVILRGQEHVVDFVNDAARPLVGPEDPTGTPARDLLLRDTSADRVATLNDVYATGKRWVGEGISSIRDWKGNGQPYQRFFNTIIEPYRGPDGQVEGLMYFAFDVTDQILATRKLEALANELESANRTKDEFLATVSHELRTPLNAILGWVRMLRGGSLPPEKRERALETIERNANAQTQLIEDLLDVSRIISGKLRLDVNTVDLHGVIENAIEAVRPAATAKNVTIKATLDPAGAPILGDADRLQQVVWNLITNAVKFTAKGGTVRVALRRRDSSVDVIVADNGIGIDAEFLPKVFERFRQADASTTRKQGGLGLGLAIVRHLVELHGGTVKVESDGRGRGATFTVTVPISPLRSTSFEQPPAIRGGRPTGGFECPSALDGIHVLVVDDEPDARELLAEILTECKAKVSSASSVSEAMRILTSLRPDIVVSDIGMPDEDGYVLIQRLRSLPRSEGGRTPAVALTAYARLEDRTKALVAGFNMHVPKPVEPSELLAVLSSLITMFTTE